jgi:short-subunit dehydrogenase
MSGGAVLVTGAAGGIGAEVARGLASNGAAVALLDRDIPALWARTEELSAAGHRVAAVVADVTGPPGFPGERCWRVTHRCSLRAQR